MNNLIAIDIGNTETTVGLKIQDEWSSFRLTTRDTDTSDEILASFNSTIQLSDSEKNKIKGSIICSVVPQLTSNMAEAVGKYLNEEPIILGPGVKTGLQVKIDNPKELGPDRIANAVAGNLLVEEDVIVVDMGTATTFDVVTKNKEYLGGSIAPGIKISLDALTSKTASLKSVELEVPNVTIGKNTYEAIQSGLIIGHASMIDNMIGRIIGELQSEPKIILTGGLGRVVTKVLDVKVQYVENLTLIGLEQIYKLNN